MEHTNDQPTVEVVSAPPAAPGVEQLSNGVAHKPAVSQPPPPQERIKEFGLSSFSLDNSTSVFLLSFIIVVFGLVAYLNMPKEQFPEIVIPTVYVNTIYPGNSPVDIENLITRPIEKELKSVKGVKKINSTSSQDVSVIIVEFNENVLIGKALQDVKDGVDKAKSELPSDLMEDPTVMEVDLSEIPIVVINLSGDFEIDKLKEYAEYLEDKIELLPEVSKVDILGALDREIQVNVNPYKMAAMNVSFSDIENAIAAENISMSGGDVLTNGFRRSMRVIAEFKSAAEIANVIVKSENITPIYLKDVAEVKDSYVERKSFARLATGESAQDGGSQPVVSLRVTKKNGENLINASEKIETLLAEARLSYLPSNLNVVLTDNQADSMKLQVSNLENSIISGVILVVAVLLFFMGLRNALFVGIAIPLSMLISFMVLSLMGITINIMVLFALILALGMLVDNAIVVVENIYRLREYGYSPMEAAKQGVGEVAWPIISSTATTLAAFLPLAFWGGIIGEFMKYLPVTLIIVLTSSLFVGLVINPVVTAKFMKVEDGATHPRKKRLAIIGAILAVLGLIAYFTSSSYALGNLLLTFSVLTFLNAFFFKQAAWWFQKKLLARLERVYVRTLRYALQGRRPYAFFGGTFVVLIFTLILFGANPPQTVLFPDSEPLYIYFYMEGSLGTDVKVTDSLTKVAEKKVYDVLRPYSSIVKSVVTNVGQGTGDPNASMTEGNQATPHKSKISIGFVDFQYREGISTSALLNEISEKLKEIPGLMVTSGKNSSGPPVGKPINIEVTGEDYITLLEEAEKIRVMIEQANIPGIDGLKLEVETGKPEVLVTVDREKARRYGLSTSLLANTLRTSIFGKEVSKLKDGEDEYPIQLRMEDRFRYDISALNDTRLIFRDNQGKFHQVPISAVADLDYSTTFGAVKRKNLDRMVEVSSEVLEGYNANEIVNGIKQLLADHKLPAGYEFKFTGEQEEQAKSMEFLSRAMLIAVSVIFLILVSQFNSVIKPFIIMTSVLFSLTGVFLGLVIFRNDFVIIMTGIGIISLAGVVVNNAIVLIDYTDQVRQRRRRELNMPEEEYLPSHEFIEVLVQAGYTRLRPVLLTAITTVLGLIPLATGLNIDFFGLYASFDPQIYVGGENADFWGPMAWTVVYGLTFATFLTLVIVPVMYRITDDIARLLAPKSVSVAPPAEQQLVS